MNKSTLRRFAIGVAVVALVVAMVFPRTNIGQRLLSGGPGPVPGPIPRPLPGTIAPAPKLKVAFIGDSSAGPDFQRVLALIRGEHSDAVVHLGDATYEGDTPEKFWEVVDRELGHDFPYFLAEGNHDAAQWPGLSSHALEHARKAGAVTGETSVADPRFAAIYKGVSLVFLGQAVNDDDPRYIIDRFSRDQHIWKICGWHKNQTALQLGGKGNGMGWGVYESCRQMGALIMTGHEHSYHRTRTLANMVEQEVDGTCSDASHLCAGPGAVPVFVSGLGGRSIRVQGRCLPSVYPYGCKGEWAFAYTSTQQAQFGALFITFDPEGDPRKAHGYFRTIDGKVVDQFELTAR